MGGNKSLNKAAKAKEDEFYTQLSDIEKELRHYKEHFRGKKVFCNCDDPFESNFFKYFALNFNELGLKKLTAMCYASSPVMYTQLDIFGNEEPVGIMDKGKKPYKLEISEVTDENGDGAIDLSDVELLIKNKHNVLTKLKGNGDFRSEESVNILKDSDIIVTNPPFSLFREYIELLINNKKKFLVIGSQNNITYKEIFPLIKSNQIWLGYHSGDMAFKVPDYYKPRETRYWVDEEGQKWRSLGNITWFTNLDIKKRHEDVVLYKTYNKDEYPEYDNYDAIEVSKVSDIPIDYDGIMGVPITFLDKYNPDQFEILGASEQCGKGFSCGIWHEDSHIAHPLIKGNKKYSRVFIRRKK